MNIALNTNHFNELIGVINHLSFKLDNSEEAIQQGGADQIEIRFDINNQQLLPIPSFPEVDQSQKTEYYTGSSVISFYEDYLSNEEKVYPGFIRISDLDASGYATWVGDFHGSFENILLVDSEEELDAQISDLIKATITPAAIYHFLKDIYSFLQQA